VTGSKRDQVAESFGGNGIAVVDQFRDGLSQVAHLRHSSRNVHFIFHKHPNSLPHLIFGTSIAGGNDGQESFGSEE